MGRPASEADLALILQPPPSAQLHPLDAGHQTLCALLRKGRALAAETGPVRLRDGLAHALALPDPALAVRHHIAPGAASSCGRPSRPGRWNACPLSRFART